MKADRSRQFCASKSSLQHRLKGKDSAESVKDVANAEFARRFDGHYGVGLLGSGDMKMLFCKRQSIK